MPNPDPGLDIHHETIVPLAVPVDVVMAVLATAQERTPVPGYTHNGNKVTMDLPLDWSRGSTTAEGRLSGTLGFEAIPSGDARTTDLRISLDADLRTVPDDLRDSLTSRFHRVLADQIIPAIEESFSDWAKLGGPEPPVASSAADADASPVAPTGTEAGEFPGEVYELDHAAERMRERQVWQTSAWLSRSMVASHVPSGLICASLTAVGTWGMVAHQGPPASMAIAGGIGLLLNALGLRRSRRRMEFELEKADLALTRQWPEAEEEPSLIATAPVFAYEDLGAGWNALDQMRRARVPLAEGEDPDTERAYFFPELREAFPPPSDAEYEALDAVREGKKKPSDVIAQLKSEEAKLRVTPEDPNTVRVMYGTIAAALNVVLDHIPDEAFDPVTIPLHPLLESRLDMFASKLGLGSVPGCVFDVQLGPNDNTIVARYSFYGDGTFGLVVVPLEKLQEAVTRQRMIDLGVPDAPPLAYDEPLGVWNAIDGLCQTFSEAEALVSQAFPNEVELRAAATTQEGAQAGHHVLNMCIQQVVNTYTSPADLDARLAAMAGIVGVGATVDSALTLTIGQAVVRYTFRGDRVETEVFTPGTPAGSPEAGAPEAAPSATQSVAPAREGL